MSVPHSALAKSNWLAAPDAKSTEWHVTMLFYAAVHAANHVLFPGGFAPAKYSHRHRDEAISKNAKLKSLAIDYQALSTLSKTARYVAQHHPMPQAKLDEAKRLAEKILRATGVL